MVAEDVISEAKNKPNYMKCKTTDIGIQSHGRKMSTIIREALGKRYETEKKKQLKLLKSLGFVKDFLQLLMCSGF